MGPKVFRSINLIPSAQCIAGPAGITEVDRNFFDGKDPEHFLGIFRIGPFHGGKFRIERFKPGPVIGPETAAAEKFGRVAQFSDHDITVLGIVEAGNQQPGPQRQGCPLCRLIKNDPE